MFSDSLPGIYLGMKNVALRGTSSPLGIRATNIFCHLEQKLVVYMFNADALMKFYNDGLFEKKITV